MAVGGSSLIMALMIVFGIFWGICFGILPRQSAFVAACLSLSSTPLVAKFVESKNRDTSSKGSVFGNNFMVRLLRFILSLVCASQKSDVRCQTLYSQSLGNSVSLPSWQASWQASRHPKHVTSYGVLIF